MMPHHGRGRGRNVTFEERELMFAEYAKGTSLGNIAKLFGVCSVTVWKYRKKDKWDERKPAVQRKIAKEVENQAAKDMARQITNMRKIQEAGMDYFDSRAAARKQGKLKVPVINNPAVALKAVIDSTEMERKITGMDERQIAEIKLVVKLPPDFPEVE